MDLAWEWLMGHCIPRGESVGGQQSPLLGRVPNITSVEELMAGLHWAAVLASQAVVLEEPVQGKKKQKKSQGKYRVQTSCTSGGDQAG